MYSIFAKRLGENRVDEHHAGCVWRGGGDGAWTYMAHGAGNVKLFSAL
jgi:hypothetical protein